MKIFYWLIIIVGVMGLASFFVVYSRLFLADLSGVVTITAIVPAKETQNNNQTSGANGHDSSGVALVVRNQASVMLPNTGDSSVQLKKDIALFKNNLKLGSKGADVKSLQQILNSYGYVVSQTGPGSPGHETDLFGQKTKSALIKLQESNIEAILKPQSLKSGTGFFGKFTRKLVNEMMLK